MTEEQWLAIPGYEGLYDVSDSGRVRSHRRRGAAGGIRKQTSHAFGYPTVDLYCNDQRATFTVHQLVALAFLGPCPAGMEVRHRDGNPVNVVPSNLAYGTHSENISDKRSHGTDHNVTKTHCPQGHPYDDANTYVLPSRPNARYCRACGNQRARDRRANSAAARKSRAGCNS